MMIFSLVAMTGLEKCCITSAYLQWYVTQVNNPWPVGLLFLYDSTNLLIFTDVEVDSKQYLSLFILAVWTVLYKFSRNHHILELLDKVSMTVSIFWHPNPLLYK